MSRKRKPTEPTIAQDPATNVALAEQDHTSTIEETASFVDRVGSIPERMAAPDPFKIAGDYLAGVHLFESRQDQQVALKFDDKPNQPVIDKLKEAGYRWNPSDRVWAHALARGSAMATRIDAERLYQEVREMTRQEKGIDIGQDVPF